ncbi:MAG: response regulator, partial [Holophagales bacterium]|nr:response regulator [Holophagales bacterium]
NGRYELCFSVRDTGVGIPEDRIDKIFESFSQADASTTRKFGGTGLGLAISKHLTELMGGRISVESSPGEGSTFRFTVKAGAAEQGMRINPIERAATGIDPDLARKMPLRILVADDSAVNQKVARLFLERMGYRADLAANGLEVLEALERQHYDVVLMDVQMPELDGLETTRKIVHDSAGGKRPRIIAVTAGAMRGDRERCLEAGMDGYVSKPVQAEELQEALIRCGGGKATPVATASDEDAGNGEGDDDVAINLNVLSDLFRLRPTVISNLVTNFLDSAAKRVAAVSKAVAEGDASALEAAAHSLKGSCGTLGAVRMARICSQLVELSRRDDLGPAAELASQLSDEHGRVRKVFRQQLEAWEQNTAP